MIMIMITDDNDKKKKIKNKNTNLTSRTTRVQICCIHIQTMLQPVYKFGYIGIACFEMYL
jgi:hypothetical protein